MASQELTRRHDLVAGLHAVRDLTSRLLCAILSAGFAGLAMLWHPGLAPQRRRM